MDFRTLIFNKIPNKHTFLLRDFNLELKLINQEMT